MKHAEGKKQGKYQLRYAAGIYWLLDMEESGREKISPLLLNECGAYIWRLHQNGNTMDEVVARLCEKYGLTNSEASADVSEFFAELEKQGIDGV